jgi:hypothetical protein
MMTNIMELCIWVHFTPGIQDSRYKSRGRLRCGGNDDACRATGRLCHGPSATDKDVVCVYAGDMAMTAAVYIADTFFWISHI